MRKDAYSILIADDELGIREGLQKILSLEGYHVNTVSTGWQAVDRIGKGDVDLAFVDLRMPDIDGCEVARQVFEKGNLRTILVILTAYASVETAVNAMKIGVADYIKKPFDNEDIISIASRYYRKSAFFEDESSLLLEGNHSSLFISDKLDEIIGTVDKIKDIDIPVLLLGESGTGKEVVAKLLHQRSGRKEKPFIGINCSAIPTELMESELFGHEKGAFSGAVKMKPGKFEIAEDGVLFLDEIGDMEYKLQAKLLRVLEEKQFERIGGVTSVPFRARVVASTNCDLQLLMGENRFRSDLYFRLKGIEITIPPLRERKQEIEFFVRRFLELFAATYGKENLRLSSEVLKRLKSYDWPGNIRELKNVVESAVILAESNSLLLPQYFTLNREEPESRLIHDLEKDYILQALEKNRFNRTLAAQELNMSRKTLYNKMKKYSIE